MTGATATPNPGPANFAGIAPGFADPGREMQACFRAVLDAMAHPGRIVELPCALPAPLPLGQAAAAIALSLCDIDTPVWLDTAASGAADYLAFHCGAPRAAKPTEASFAFTGDAEKLPPLDRFALGTGEYPERGTTLMIEVAGLADRSGVMLRGPGIDGETRLAVTGLPARFWGEREALAELFPRGLDVIFTCGNALAALPRSTRATL